MPPRKRTKTGESIEQSSAIDSGSKSPTMAYVVCGGGARSDAQPHVEQQVVGSSSRGGGGGGGDGRSSSGARIPRKEAAPCAEGTLDGTGQSQKRLYARGRCLAIYDYMIKPRVRIFQNRSRRARPQCGNGGAGSTASGRSADSAQGWDSLPAGLLDRVLQVFAHARARTCPASLRRLLAGCGRARVLAMHGLSAGRALEIVMMCASVRREPARQRRLVLM